LLLRLFNSGVKTPNGGMAMRVHKTKRTNRLLKAALLTVLVSGSMSLLGSSPALAAVLSFGLFPGNVFGGESCADVKGGVLANMTPVEAYQCTAAPNQQFEFSGLTIYALGGQACLNVEYPDDLTPPTGTPVDIYVCNGGPHQQWTYSNGHIINGSLFSLPAARAAITSLAPTVAHSVWMLRMGRT
jgi:Ricin-type beta-trefoil lectin domain